MKIPHILIAPDKFKGTLTAQAAATAIARGWRSARPQDHLELLPFSDGGDGFGEVLSALIHAKSRVIHTLNAAHLPIRAQWWWQANTKTAVIESARVIGLAMLPPGKFHPFQLDTYGLGRLLFAAQKNGAKQCLIGIGGSATNDGGFGLARSLGWRFFDRAGNELLEWWQLTHLANITRPDYTLNLKVTVAVDVRNRLLGPKGCSRIYGPQKGLRREDFALAENCLRKLHQVLKRQHALDCASIPGAGAAGGLGFGVMAFARAKIQSGFDLVANLSNLKKRIRASDLVITGEGAIDRQTYMGKGVGQIARLCKKAHVPCLALAGTILDPKIAHRHFAQAHALTEITTLANAQRHPARHLQAIATHVAFSHAFPPKTPSPSPFFSVI